MTVATKVNHPHFPAHMTRTSFGNVAACCTAPVEDHPAFVDGTPARVRLARDVRRLSGAIMPKGTVLEATRSNHESTLQEVRPSRWGTIPDGPYAGTFAELDKGEFKMVNNPGWTVRFPGDTHLTGIPWKWAKEIA